MQKDPKDSYMALLTLLSHYEPYVDDMGALLKQINEDINNFIFEG